MSQYLISQLKELGNVEVRTSTEVVSSNPILALRALMLSSGGTMARLSTDVLFVCIGGMPRTQGAANVGLARDDAGYRAYRDRTHLVARRLGRLAVVSATLATRNEPARAVRRRRRPEWVDQALRGRHR